MTTRQCANQRLVVALIPARGGSKGIPSKNLVKLWGYPLIAYSIAAARTCPLIDETIVTTDSEEIAAVAGAFGAEVPFLRPAEISGDRSLDIEFFRHYLDFLKARGRPIPALIVHLRPTTPLRDPGVLSSAIEYMRNNDRATALRSGYETHLTPYKIFRSEDGFMRPFLDYPGVKEFYNLPRQTFEPAYIPNGYVDVVRPEILETTGLLHGERIKLWETEKVPDIDVIQDIAVAEESAKDGKFESIVKYLESVK